MTMYGKYFYGFAPEVHPIITFARAGDRDSLLRTAERGELILYIGTQGEETDVAEQGRLLGVAMIGDKSVKSDEVIDLSSAPANHFENGRYRWPEGIPMLQAWRFDPPRPLAREVLSTPLRPDAQVRAVPLAANDEAAVRALIWVEVALPETAERRRQRLRTEAFATRPSRPGPIAGPGAHIVTRRETGCAFTYAFRFGDTSIWKIGCALDVERRCEVINAHVPFEYLGRRWELKFQQRWPSLQEARDMEQRLLERLVDYRTQGERVRWAEEILKRAWIDSFAGDKA